MTLRSPDVAPGDHEDGVAFGDGVGNKRVLGLKIEDVVLVDAGWNDHQRASRHLRRCWLVLYELDELVLVHDFTGRNRKIAADLERRVVGLADALPPGIGEQVR